MNRLHQLPPDTSSHAYQELHDLYADISQEMTGFFIAQSFDLFLLSKPIAPLKGIGETP